MQGGNMQIDVGKFYFIKDEFFEIASDTELMKNIVFPDIDNILKNLDNSIHNVL